LGNALVRALGIEPASEHELAATPEDLQMLIAQSEQEGALDPGEADMLEGVFNLHETAARDVMTPRPEVRDLAAGLAVRPALEAALGSNHSRFPVTGPDGVLGVVLLSD